MHSLFFAVPFLIAPFSLPGVSSGSRLAAFLFAAALAAHGLVARLRRDGPLAFNLLREPAVWLTWLAALWIFWSVDGTWQRHFLLPALLTGVLLPFAALNGRGSAIHGLGILSAVLWGMLMVSSAAPAFFPMETFHENLPGILASGNAGAEAGARAERVRTPDIETSSYLLAMALLSATVFLFAAYFDTGARGRRAAHGVIGLTLIPWCAVLVYCGGSPAYLMLILALGSFFLLYKIPRKAVDASGLWGWAFAFGLLGLGAAGHLTFLSVRMAEWFAAAPRLEPPILFLRPFELPLFIDPAVFDPGGREYLRDCLLLLVFAAALAATRWRAALRDEPALAAYTALAAGSILCLPPRPLEWVCQPFLWISAAAILAEPPPSPRFLRLEWPVRPLHAGIAGGAALGIMAIAALALLIPEIGAERSQARLMAADSSEELLHAASEAYRSADYRADLTVAYVSIALRALGRAGESLSNAQLAELELAHQKGVRYGYSDPFAVREISEWHFGRGETVRSLNMLADAVRFAPEHVSLRELYAERLFELQRYREALEQYNHCIGQSPTTARYHQKTAEIYDILQMELERDAALRSYRMLNPLAESG